MTDLVTVQDAMRGHAAASASNASRADGSDEAGRSEAVNDRAKLLMHRLIARQITRDPRLLDEARATVPRLAAAYPDSSFPAEWTAILRLPTVTIRRMLSSRSETMQRLRLSSPFTTGESMALIRKPALRRRIWRLARKGAGATTPT